MPQIRRIDGIDDVKTTLFMPGEREKNQLSAILRTLPDPVFSIDQSSKVKFIQQDYLADMLPITVPDGEQNMIMAGAVVILKSEMRLGQQFTARSISLPLIALTALSLNLRL